MGIAYSNCIIILDHDLGYCLYIVHVLCVCVGCPPPDNGHMDTLKKCFGFSKFKPLVTQTVSHDSTVYFCIHVCTCVYVCMHNIYVLLIMYLTHNYSFNVSLHSDQWKIIHSVLYSRKDNCAVMATGQF